MQIVGVPMWRLKYNFYKGDNYKRKKIRTRQTDRQVDCSTGRQENELMAEFYYASILEYSDSEVSAQ